MIAVPGKKDGVLSFPAGDVKKPERPDRRAELHHLITHVRGADSPIIIIRLIALLIIRDPSLLGRIAEKRIDAAVQDVCQKRQSGNIRNRIPVFPF